MRAAKDSSRSCAFAPCSEVRGGFGNPSSLQRTFLECFKSSARTSLFRLDNGSCLVGNDTVGRRMREAAEVPPGLNFERVTLPRMSREGSSGLHDVVAILPARTNHLGTRRNDKRRAHFVRIEQRSLDRDGGSRDSLAGVHGLALSQDEGEGDHTEACKDLFQGPGKD